MKLSNISDKIIKDRLFQYKKDFYKRLVITPILSMKDQIQGGVVDLRLGTEFILTQKTKFSVIDQKSQDLADQIKHYQKRLIISFKDQLVLHPNQFILGSTLEYIKVPQDWIGYIVGRSSWGRIGLIIATAILIHPGYAGIITLELTNLGETPIVLYPGRRIAQISFHKLDLSDEEMKKDLEVKSRKPSRYYGAIRPNYSLIFKDTDKALFK